MARGIADEEGLPPFFLAKTLQSLARQGIVRSAKGPTGGFSLATPAKKIRLLDVIAAVDGTDGVEGGQAELPDVVQATNPTRSLPHRLHGRQQHGNQNPDDRDQSNEQECDGGCVQYEIKQAMYKNRKAAGERPRRRSPDKRIPGSHHTKSAAKQEKQKE